MRIDNTSGLDPSIDIRSNSQNGLISLSEHPKLESLYNIARQNFPGNRALKLLAESLYRLFTNQRNAVNVLKQSKSFSSTGNLPFADENDSKVFWYSFLLKEHNLYAAKQEETQGNQAARNNFFARFLPGKSSN